MRPSGGKLRPLVRTISLPLRHSHGILLTHGDEIRDLVESPSTASSLRWTSRLEAPPPGVPKRYILVWPQGPVPPAALRSGCGHSFGLGHCRVSLCPGDGYCTGPPPHRLVP